MSITPKAIQDLLDELEASRQARRRAWDVLQELRAVLTNFGNVTIRGSFAKNIRGRGSNPKTGFERLSSRSKSGSGATRGCRQAGRLLLDRRQILAQRTRRSSRPSTGRRFCYKVEPCAVGT